MGFAPENILSKEQPKANVATVLKVIKRNSCSGTRTMIHQASCSQHCAPVGHFSRSWGTFVSGQGLGRRSHSRGPLQLTLSTGEAVEKPQVRKQRSAGDRELLPGQAHHPVWRWGTCLSLQHYREPVKMSSSI